ncbi:MAG: LamG domain-containing protein, partial [Patescibacteria group bacterium]
ENTGTTAYDSSGNGFNGTLTGGPTWQVGKKGQSVKFDGINDYINIPWSTNLPNGTIQMWFKSNETDNDTGIFLEGDGTVSASSPSFEGTSTTMRFYVGNGCNLNISYSQNTWTHFVGVWNGTNNYLYKNGVLVASGACTNTESGFTKFVIGSRSGSNANNVTVDDVKIYNYARTPRQILEDMNSGQGKSVNWWRLDEGQGSTAYNSITGGANGNISNATWTTSGKQSKALSFNGTSSVVTIASPLGSTGPNQLTLSTWLKRTRTATQEYVVDSDGDESTIMILSNDKVRCNYWNGTASQYVDSNVTITDTNWHHVTCAFDYGNNIKVYIDGQLDNTNSAPSGVLGNGALTNSYIGARGVIAGFFSGLIDEVKMYSYALTASDVKKDYNQGAAAALGSGVEPGNTGNAPVAWWKLDDNTGTTAVDSSGNGLNGSFVNSPTWTAGKFGSSLKFTGSPHTVSTPTLQSVLNGKSGMTVSAWIQPTDITSSAYYEIMRQQTGGTPDWLLSFQDSGTILSFGLATSISYSELDVPITASYFTDGKWHHVEVTYDGAIKKMYIDGILKTTTESKTGTIVSSSATNYIGSSAGSSEFFKGKIDEIRVYDYARTQAQVAYDYNR